MNFFPIREQTWRFLRAFFMTSTVHHITAGTLAKLILSSLKLFPVALTAQFTGMASLSGRLLASGVSEVFLTVWFCCGLFRSGCRFATCVFSGVTRTARPTFASGSAVGRRSPSRQASSGA